MKSKMRAAPAALGILLAVCLAGACKKNDSATKEPIQGGTTPAAEAWFQLIPADSPLVMANLRPMPDSLIDWAAGGLAPVGEMLEKKLQEEMATTQDEKERAVLTEVQGKLSRDGLRSIGVSLQPRFAMYAIGLSLAMRMELADGKRFADFVDRLEAASGVSMEKATLEDISYRVHTDDEITMVFAIHGNEAVLGVMHPNAREQVVPVLLGKQAPEASLADSRALEALVAKYELMGVSPGYLDVPALVRMLTGRGSALSTSIVAASGVELPPLSATCHEELDRMAAVAPRIVFGYRSIFGKTGGDKGQGIETLSVWEMRSDLAKEIAALRAPVPGVSGLRDDQPLFAMALGLDLGRALSWVQDKAKTLQAAPFQCEHLGELNEVVAEAARGAGKELPPFVTGFKGAALAVTAFSMNGFMPSGAGYALLGMENPMALLEMAKAEIPQLAEVEIQAGGEPTAIPLGIPGIDTLHVAVQGSWIGAAVGDDMAKRMVGLIHEKPHEKPGPENPLLVFAYNYKQLMQIMTQSGAMANAGEEAQIMEAIGNMLGFTMVDMSVDERGLVMRQTIQPL